MNPKVTIVGAGNVGSALAQRLVEKNLADVFLVDIVAGRSQGIALDLMQARAIEHHDRVIVGTSDYSDTAHSAVIVVTAGLPRKPGMSREELLKVNGEVVAEVTSRAVSYSPDAILVVVTNPLDVMTHLAWRQSGFPTHRVMGMAGVLDAARFQTFIALELGISTEDIRAMVLGSHGDLMVPLPRHTTVAGIALTELLPPPVIDRLVERTRHGGAEIVQLMQTGSAFYAPASAACVMLESILLDRKRILPVAAYLEGQYGLQGLFLGVPAQLGKQGIDRVVELALTPEELQALHTSAQAVQANLQNLPNQGYNLFSV